MKNFSTLLVALLIATVAFGQKKELKKAEKAFVKKDMQGAMEYLKKAEALIGNADQDLKTNFYVTKGEIVLADAGKNYEKIKEAAEAYKMAQELDTDNNYKGLIDNGVNNVRVALVNSAVADQRNNPKLAAEKLYLSYQVKKDTSDLYFAAGNALNAKDYDKALQYYEKLLELGYTGIQEEFIALRIEDGETVTFASKEDRDSEMISGKYTKPEQRMSKSSKGDILRSVVLIYSSKGENEKAIKLMKEARAENPDDMSLVRAEADMVYRMGDMVKYNALMEEVLASDPTNPELYYNLGVATAANGNKEKAKEYYRKAIELKPEYPAAQINIASLMLSEEKAIVDEMNGLGMSKADSKRYDELTAKREGLYRSAMPYLESAMKSRSDNVELVRTLMNIYSQLGMDGKFKAMKAKLAEMEGR